MARRYYYGSKIKHSKNKQSLEWMKPIFEQWIRYNKRYQKIHDGELLSMFGERPNVGVLAAAAWSIKDGSALQEYYAEKINPKDRRKTKSGREDLYLGLGKKKSLKVEAKCLRFNAHRALKKGSFNEKFQNCKKDAINDAKRLIKDDKRAAMVIVQFQSLSNKMNVDLIKQALKEINDVKIQAKAWYIADMEIDLNEKYHCFGTALFITGYLKRSKR